MLCTSCRRREASVFIEHTIGTKTEKMSLCEKCAEKGGESLSGSPPKKGSELLFSSLIRDTCSGAVCPVCSSGIKDIISGRGARCAACYITFAPELADALSALHGSSLHTGDAPKKYSERKDREKQLILLKAKLEHEIRNENFELCASLRDEIAMLSAKNTEANENGVV